MSGRVVGIPVIVILTVVMRKTGTAKSSSGSSWLRMPSSQNTTLLFDKTNYILLGLGGLLIILGFILMSGGNTDPKIFNEAEIYSFRMNYVSSYCCYCRVYSNYCCHFKKTI